MTYDRQPKSSTRLFVGGLGDAVPKEELQREFEKFGRLSHVWVAQHPPGFAFVEFENERDASDAVNEMNGATIMGNQIRVEHSRERRRGGGRGGGGGGFRGGRGGGGYGGGGRGGGGYRGGRGGGYGGGERRFGGGGGGGRRYDDGGYGGGGDRGYGGGGGDRGYRSRSPMNDY